MEYSKIPLLIVGAGAEGRMVLDIANQLDVLVYGFLTDDADLVQTELNDILVVASLGDKDSDTLLAEEHIRIVIAEREIEKRKELVDELESVAAKVINATHPLNVISPYAKLGMGNIIHAGTIIHTNTQVYNFNIFGTSVIVEADAEIGSYCTLQSGSKIGMNAKVEDEVIIGMGSIIQAGVTIEEGAIVAPGSVVYKNVSAGSTVFGNPAKAST